MNQKKGILILGGNGFVGQRLIHSLPGPVYVISRSLMENVPPHVCVYQVSLDDVDTTSKILPSCRWVVHLASDSTPGTSADNPLLEAERNLLPSLRFLQQLQIHPEVNILYLSSGGTVYGNAVSMSIREDERLSPLSFYAAGKVSLECFIMALVHQSPRSGVILRPSNIYGPGQLYRAGFGIIPTILECQRHNRPLLIWGDGENVRDYIFIDDFIDICLKILNQPVPKRGIEVYNVGSNIGCSLNQLCELVERVTGQQVMREYRPPRNFDVNHVVLDVMKVSETFGWFPSTSLKDGLKKTWEWWKNL